jgi:hypothetical protein
MTGRFADEHAFRTSLEQRLLNQARESGRPLDRLRKEVAHQRFLARLAEAAPNSWALKGGLALLARLGDQARATSDADANWRANVDDLEKTLDRVSGMELGDGFSFEIGRPRPLEGEVEGALRFPVVAVLDGREFERIHLDINLLPMDRRETEEIRLRDVLEFAEIPAPVVPVIPIGQQLSEKIHAFVRSYGNGSSRPRDLYDMLVIAEQLPIPPARALAEICSDTFRIRDSSWPPGLPDPPQDWAEAWAGFVDVYGIPWTSLEDAGGALRAFWDHVMSTEITDAIWNPDIWVWVPEGA